MKNIEVVVIPVSDQQKSKEFYMTVGFKVLVEEPMGNGENWVQLGIPNQVTSITLSKKKSGKDPAALGFNQGIMLATDDIEKEVRELKAKGIEVKKIDDTPWGRFTHFADPDGNEVAFHEEKKK